MGKVSLTIDGRAVSVERGGSVLDAARSLGIAIPRLCHVEGLEPVSACFLCCVQVAGMRTLSPSCALLAADGMVVTTQGEDIRASRRMALELLLSDHAGECVAPCAARCPAGLDVPGFVYEIASGQSERAMERIYETLSLPGARGRVCPRLCEASCRRCDYDREGLAIGALHRYATDRSLAAARPALPRRGVSYWIHGRDLPGYPASHGCIGLYDEPMQNEQYGTPKNPELNDAKRLFEWVFGGEAEDEKVIPLAQGPRLQIIGEATKRERR